MKFKLFSIYVPIDKSKEFLTAERVRHKAHSYGHIDNVSYILFKKIDDVFYEYSSEDFDAYCWDCRKGAKVLSFNRRKGIYWNAYYNVNCRKCTIRDSFLVDKDLF